MSINDITVERKNEIIVNLVDGMFDDLDPDFWEETIFEIMTKEELEAFGYCIPD